MRIAGGLPEKYPRKWYPVKKSTEFHGFRFNFIGMYLLPVEPVSEEARMQQLEAEMEQNKKEKNKRAAERRRERIQAMREAAEAGDPEAAAWVEKYQAQRRAAGARRTTQMKAAREADPEYIRKMEEKERMKNDPVYAAEIGERKKEYNRRRTEKRSVELAELKKRAETDPQAAQELAQHRAYYAQKTKEYNVRLAAQAEAGNEAAIRKLEERRARNIISAKASANAKKQKEAIAV